MEKTRPHRSIDFHHRRNPRSITRRRLGRNLPQMLAETTGNPAQLCRPLRNVSAADIIVMFHNQPLNFILQPANFLLRQRDLALSLPWPNQSSIECLRRKIGGEQGDGSKTDQLHRPYRSAKMAMI